MTIVKTEQLSSHPDVLKQLPHIQSAFMSLLSQDDGALDSQSFYIYA